MDIVKPKNKHKIWKKRLMVGALPIAVVLVILWTYGKEDLPEVMGDQLRLGTVKRGPLVREIRGHGSLQPVDPHFVTALSTGVVKKVHVRPGDLVSANSLLLTLENPAVVQADLEATLEVDSAEAALQAERARREQDRLAQAAAVTLAELQVEEAEVQLKAQKRLFQEGIVSEIVRMEAEIRLKERRTRLELERKRRAQLETLIQAELTAREKQLRQLQQRAALHRQRAEALRVVAGIAGVLQECPWRTGQQISQGDRIARIASPDDLQAELLIPETRAREVKAGMMVRVGTRGTVLAGQVSRIAPVANNGTVQVEVRLLDPLPAEARPDLTVDGYIELTRLENVLFIERPAFGAANDSVTMFRINDERGDTASRVEVTFGASSYRTIQITAGLMENDRVILSETPGHLDTQELRIR